METAILYFNNIRLNPSQIHKLRGYVGNVFKSYDLIHNHDIVTGKVIYRYPLIQFKLIGNVPAIISITERAIKVFGEIFMQLDHIRINGCKIPVHEKNLKVDDVEFGFSKETFIYEFASPWIGLNQKNYISYKSLKTESERGSLLRRILVGNMLSMAKYLDVYLKKEQQITVDLKLHPQQVNLKGKQMTAFKGIFKTNFMIPDYLGLGKSVSRGFGAIRRVL